MESGNAEYHYYTLNPKKSWILGVMESGNAEYHYYTLNPKNHEF